MVALDIPVITPVHFRIGLEVPNIPRRPFEKFLEAMTTTLQSSRHPFICDYMLANLTHGTIAGDYKPIDK